MAHDYTGAKVFHAECGKVNRFDEQELKEMNRSHEHVMKECKK